MHYLRPLLFSALGFISTDLYSRPVSYADSWTVTQNNNWNGSSIELTYSPSAFYAYGWQSQFHPNPEKSYHTLVGNALLKRWNLEGAQSNIFLLSGIGASLNRERVGAAAFAGIAADYETRRFMIAYTAKATYAQRVERSLTQTARVGIAPYLSGFYSLQPWIILQVEQKNTIMTISPLIRFYKHNVLVEFGMSTRGDVLFNWVVTF